LAEQEAALELEQDASEGDLVAPRIPPPPRMEDENELREEAALLRPQDTAGGNGVAHVPLRISSPPGIDDENELPEEAALLQPHDTQEQPSPCLWTERAVNEHAEW